MLARKSYSAAEVAAARSSMERWIAAARSGPDGADLVDALVIALDAQFVHRTRGLEGKDASGPLKRVRALAESAIAGETLDLDLDAVAALAAEVHAEIETRFPPD